MCRLCLVAIQQSCVNFFGIDSLKQRICNCFSRFQWDQDLRCNFLTTMGVVRQSEDNSKARTSFTDTTNTRDIRVCNRDRLQKDNSVVNHDCALTNSVWRFPKVRRPQIAVMGKCPLAFVVHPLESLAHALARSIGGHYNLSRVALRRGLKAYGARPRLCASLAGVLRLGPAAACRSLQVDVRGAA